MTTKRKEYAAVGSFGRAFNQRMFELDFANEIHDLNKTIQELATSRSRHILFPDDKRTDKEVANHLRWVICQFMVDKTRRFGKIKPVRECKRNNL